MSPKKQEERIVWTRANAAKRASAYSSGVSVPSTPAHVHDERYYTEAEVLALLDALTADDIDAAALAGATYGTLQDIIDLYDSAGWISGGDFTDNGSLNVTIAAGTGLLRATDDELDRLYFIDWPAYTDDLDPDTVYYIGVEYNAGSPQVTLRTAWDWDFNTDFPLVTVVTETSTLHFEPSRHSVANAAGEIIQRLYQTQPWQRDNRGGGLILGESGDGNRYVTVTAGAVWDKLNRFIFGAFDSDPGGGAGEFDTYYQDGLGDWTLTTGETQWDNTHYDDGSGILATMTNNRYAVLWVYSEADGDIVILYGSDEYVQVDQANDEPRPLDLPDRLVVHAFLLGRIIFKKSASTATQVQSAWDTTFSTATSLPATIAYTDQANVFTADQYVGQDTAQSALRINGPAGVSRSLTLHSAGSLRWAIQANATPESGSNAGSDLDILARDDSGAALYTALSFARATGKPTFSSATPVFGAFTLTIPATGTVALLATANIFAANQQIGTDTTTRNLQMNGPAGVARQINFYTAGVLRWALSGASAAAESGSNAGSDFQLLARNDSGGALFTALTILRANAHVLVNTTTDAGQLTVNGQIALVDGMSAPAAVGGFAQIYVDTADGDLKVRFGDGTIKTIVVDT